MRISSSIEDPSVIRTILAHLGLWLARARPPPKIHAPPICLQSTGRTAAPYITDDVCCKLPINDDHLYRDPEYSWDDYRKELNNKEKYRLTRSIQPIATLRLISPLR
jgi:hypothetical protein